VPEGVRQWAAGILGAPITAGQGVLLSATILARLAIAPNTVVSSPSPVRLWSAGASGGTHQDVRLVMGSRVRAELEDLSLVLHGTGLSGGDIGVLQLPDDPVVDPLRLTLFRPPDRAFTTLDGLAQRTGGQQKRQAVVTALPELPPWP
jgi:hypothetical protein